MRAPAAHEFRPGRPPGAFSRWLLSLRLGRVYPVPPEYAAIPGHNVSGQTGALAAAGLRPRFRNMNGARYVFVERIT